MERFADRVGLVTGGSEGIGLAIARRLISEGATAYICGRREDVLAAAGESLGIGAHARRLDVADTSALQELIAEIQATHGCFDFLVNNAMHVGWSSIADTGLEDFQRDFRINVDAAFASTQAALTPMQAQGRGAVLNVASINGLLAIDNMAAYSASKAALIHFSRCAAMEGAPPTTAVTRCMNSWAGATRNSRRAGRPRPTWITSFSWRTTAGKACWA